MAASKPYANPDGWAFLRPNDGARAAVRARFHADFGNAFSLSRWLAPCAENGASSLRDLIAPVQHCTPCPGPSCHSPDTEHEPEHRKAGYCVMFFDFGSPSAVSTGRDLRPGAGDPIDLKHLGRYTLGDAGLEREVLGLFAGQVPVTIAALKEASSDKDWQMAAHTLKGSGRAVGAWHLADLALQAESIRGAYDRTAGASIVRQIEAAAAEVARYIGALPHLQAR